MEMSKFETIDSVVRQICRLRKDPEARGYVLVSSTVKRVLEQLNAYAFNTIKGVVFKLDETFMYKLPDDCVSVTKVGVSVGEKRLRVMRQDDDLNIYKSPDCECNEETEETETSCAACTFHNIHSYSGINCGVMYGYREKQTPNGVYRINHTDGVINFGTGYDIKPDQEVVIEYNSSLSSDDLALIPKLAFMAIYYRTSQLLDSYDRPSVSGMNFVQFMREFKTLKQYYNRVSVKDIVSALRGQYTPVI